ncbi:MAG: sel1 repeat family protein [Prevotellaceae bacterium]|jgi:hypothetical protein|nr:sel1 repeat family protein [Prevotellaceae bacterium]
MKRIIFVLILLFSISNVSAKGIYKILEKGRSALQANKIDLAKNYFEEALKKSNEYSAYHALEELVNLYVLLNDVEKVKYYANLSYTDRYGGSLAKYYPLNYEFRYAPVYLYIVGENYEEALDYLNNHMKDYNGNESSREFYKYFLYNKLNMRYDFSVVSFPLYSSFYTLKNSNIELRIEIAYKYYHDFITSNSNVEISDEGVNQILKVIEDYLTTSEGQNNKEAMRLKTHYTDELAWREFKRYINYYDESSIENKYIKNRPATDPVTYFAQAVIKSREASGQYGWSQVLPNYDKAIYWGIDEKMPMNDVRKRIGIATYLAKKDSDNWITEEKSDYAIDMITEYIEKYPNDIEAIFYRAKLCDVFGKNIYARSALAKDDYQSVLDSRIDDKYKINESWEGVRAMKKRLDEMDKVEADRQWRRNMIARAESNEDYAMSFLSYAYSGFKGFPRDNDKVFYWALKSAENGNATGQYNLAICYEFGQGTPKDKTLALYWYRKSAEQGYSDAKQKVTTLEAEMRNEAGYRAVSTQFKELTPTEFSNRVYNFNISNNRSLMRVYRPTVIHILSSQNKANNDMTSILDLYANDHPHFNLYRFENGEKEGISGSEQELRDMVVSKMNIKNYPTIILLRPNGRYVAFEGTMTLKELENLLDDHFFKDGSFPHSKVELF